MPGMRRSCGEHRPAREDGGAQDPGFIVDQGSRSEVGMSTLSDRLRGIIKPPPRADVVARANPSDLENLLEGRWYGHCFIVERHMATSAKYGHATIGDLAEKL